MKSLIKTINKIFSNSEIPDKIGKINPLRKLITQFEQKCTQLKDRLIDHDADTTQDRAKISGEIEGIDYYLNATSIYF